FQVARVGFGDVVAVLLQRLGHGQEALVLFRRGKPGQFMRRSLGLAGQLRHLFPQRHGVKVKRKPRTEKAEVLLWVARRKQKGRAFARPFHHNENKALTLNFSQLRWLRTTSTDAAPQTYAPITHE